MSLDQWKQRLCVPSFNDKHTHFLHLRAHRCDICTNVATLVGVNADAIPHKFDESTNLKRCVLADQYLPLHFLFKHLCQSLSLSLMTFHTNLLLILSTHASLGQIDCSSISSFVTKNALSSFLSASKRYKSLFVFIEVIVILDIS